MNALSWFIRRREVRQITWPGRLILFALALGALRLAAPAVYDFLAGPAPKSGGAFIVEGWLDDDGLRAFVAFASTGAVRHIFATGGPIEYGATLLPFATYADATAVRLLRAGVESNRVTAVPAPRARTDRTWASAMALSRYLDERGERKGAFVLATHAPHARRSGFLFKEALGGGCTVEVLAITPANYDRRTWWRCSDGFKTVIFELLAYPYARASRLLDRSP